MDCLVCHDRSGKYAKAKNDCGYPNKGVGLAAAAKSVGLPGRENCGACHWHGGGGNNVKHGDMGDTLADPDRSHDVHMGGLDFTCQDCHVSKNHKIAGSSTTSAVSEGVVACTDCHDDRPHEDSFPLVAKLNDHCASIACQTCHIPSFAKNDMTMTLWDWSRTAEADEILLEKPALKKVLNYKKGLTMMERNLRPVYAWFNGSHRRHAKPHYHNSSCRNRRSPREQGRCGYPAWRAHFVELGDRSVSAAEKRQDASDGNRTSLGIHSSPAIISANSEQKIGSKDR